MATRKVSAGMNMPTSWPPIDPEVSRSIGYLVRHAHRAFDRVLSAELAPLDVLTGQWSALRVLWHEDGISQVELATRMRIEKASLTALLVAMENFDLITRSSDPQDGRKLIIKLTAKGRRIKGRLVPIAESVNTVATRGLSQQELATLRDLLLRLIVNLEK